MHDDSDIKIFKSKSDEADGADLYALAEEMRRNIVNGNSAKAKELGVKLASLSPESDDLGEELIKYVRNTAADEEIKDQIVTLMIFCAEYTLLGELCPMLAASATETMYNVIKIYYLSTCHLSIYLSIIYFLSIYTLGFPGRTSGNESACQCKGPKRLGLDPWIRKISWSRKSSPLHRVRHD